MDIDHSSISETKSKHKSLKALVFLKKFKDESTYKKKIEKKL